MAKILVVEDDLALSAGLCFALDESGHLTAAAYTCQKARQLLKTDRFDLVILDVNLPDGNGFDLCRECKSSTPERPVIFLTANDLEQDELNGFDLGADDYITKPFSPKELVLRVNNIIKRAYKDNSNRIAVDGYELDEVQRKIYADNVEIELTTKEFDLLTFLAENPNLVFSKDTLFDRVWGMDSLGDAATVTVHINRLRDKLGKNESKNQFIETVWGAGYRFRID